MEYKFRGKMKDNGEWVTGNYVSTDPTEAFILIGVTGHIKRDDYECYMVEVLPETVGIHFGWVDSDENEIYTGDQLEIFWTENESTCETISYSQEYGYFMYGNNPVCELVESKVKSKVVGNIHELNPAKGAVDYNMKDPNQQQQEAAGQAAEANAQETAAQDTAMEATDSEEGTEG